MSNGKTTELHSHISKYLEKHKKLFITDEFVYTSWNSPHTMYNVSNDIDELLLTLSDSSIRFWHRTLAQLRRNHDPAIACSVEIKYSHYKDVISRNSYYTAKSQLVDNKLIIPTDNHAIYIVNINYANKLYKPELEV